MFSKAFWVDAGERAIRTFAQAALAVLGISGTDVIHTSWVGVVSAAAGAAVLSLLTSFAAVGLGGGTSAALVDADPPPLSAAMAALKAAQDARRGPSITTPDPKS